MAPAASASASLRWLLAGVGVIIIYLVAVDSTTVQPVRTGTV